MENFEFVENSVENVKNFMILHTVMWKNSFQPAKNGKNLIFAVKPALFLLKSFQQAVENFVDNFTDSKTWHQFLAYKWNIELYYFGLFSHFNIQKLIIAEKVENFL